MILCLDSNPWPLNHEASPTMTKAYAPLYLFLIPFSFSLFALLFARDFGLKIVIESTETRNTPFEIFQF